jgi:acyl-CoA synthetase (AMP-forming)/AMP-acid ligase II
MLQPRSFDMLLRLAADTFGDRVFLSDDDLLGNVSYGEAQAFANGISRRLDSLGVPQGACVASIFHNCGLAALGFLAIIASRRVLVPLNPTSTKEELDYMLDRSGCAAVVLDHIRPSAVLRGSSCNRDTSGLETRSSGALCRRSSIYFGIDWAP